MIRLKKGIASRCWENLVRNNYPFRWLILQLYHTQSMQLIVIHVPHILVCACTNTGSHCFCRRLCTVLHFLHIVLFLLYI